MNSAAMNEQTRHGLACIWNDCYRQGQNPAQQVTMFSERLDALLSEATDGNVTLNKIRWGQR